MPISDALSGDVVLQHQFHVDMSGKLKGFFTEVGGMNLEMEVVDLKIVDEKGRDVIRKVAGRLQAGEVTLKRPVTTNKDAWDWRKLVEDGKVSDARTSGTISALDQEGNVAASWTITAAWPSKISATSLDASGASIVYEELTLQFEASARVS